MAYANINNVKEGVFRIANKQQKGAITDIDFNRFASIAQMEVVNALFEKKNLYIKQRLKFFSRIDGVLDITVVEDILQPLLIDGETLTQGSVADLFNLPQELYTIEDVFVGEQRVDIESAANVRRMSMSSLIEPTIHSYVATRKNKKEIRIIPQPVGVDVEMNYYKRPQGTDLNGDPVALQPTWASTLVGNALVYNPATSINFEIGVAAENLLIRKVLEYVGINLSNDELLAWLQSEREKSAREFYITNQSIS